MDLKEYYQKLRQTEGSLPEQDAVIASLKTPDGGRAGILTEAPRAIAAKLIVEGGARLATEEETEQFREQNNERRRLAEQAAIASRLQVTVVAGAGNREEARRQKSRGKSEQE
jgi:hypothetical protein